MKKNFFLQVLLLSLCFPAWSQYDRFIVRLSDKNGNGFSIDNPGQFLSPAALQRRDRQHIGIDNSDLPVTKKYIDSIAGIPGVTVINYSKWFNQVLIRTSDSNALQKIHGFSFVISTDSVAADRLRYEGPVRVKFDETVYPVAGNTISNDIGQLEQTTDMISGNYFDYGYSYSQIRIHHGEYLHNLGFHGEGIKIAILDGGFNGYATNPAFDSIRNSNRILGTYDYVNQKVSVNEENIHGAYCFSIIAANEPGLIVGTAPGASYWLLKTEDVNSESPVEEQNWTVAAEFADSAGVDLISTSLGYAYFDNPVYNHSYAERNGHTALVTRAANTAVSKGMIVSASAGNSGTATDEVKYVICPGDGDSVITVGAIGIDSTIAQFSSWGPNSSGGIKPNVVSVGSGTFIAEPDGHAIRGNGTSFSNPNMAGLIACLWQAFPGVANYDIMDAIQQSADRHANPDNRFGYGIPDFQKAYYYLKNNHKLPQDSITGLPPGQWIRAFPVPFSNQLQVEIQPLESGTAAITLLDAIGRKIETRQITVSAGQLQLVSFSRVPFLQGGVYFIHYTGSKESKTISVMKP